MIRKPATFFQGFNPDYGMKQYYEHYPVVDTNNPVMDQGTVCRDCIHLEYEAERITADPYYSNLESYSCDEESENFGTKEECWRYIGGERHEWLDEQLTEIWNE